MSDDRTLETYPIGIAIDGVPTYVLDVPTTLGREAAERRARVTIFHHDRIDLDRITVCDPGPTEE